MTTFVLLHGAWHGAWCWAGLQDELTARGIDSLAIDLPADEPDAGIQRYADVVEQGVDARKDVVVVAHSLAGLVAPVAGERLGARGIVMLAALWPTPGRSAREQARDLPGIYTDRYRQAPRIRYDDGSTAMPPEVAVYLLYQDCAPTVASAASGWLRPQHWRIWSEACPLVEWPGLPTAAVACRHDRMLEAEGMVRGSARAAAPLSWLPSGHSPMLSMPAALADELMRVTGEFPA